MVDNQVAEGVIRNRGEAMAIIRGSRRARGLVGLALVASMLITAFVAAPVAAGSSAWFSSPSGNIGCSMTVAGVRCDTITYSYKPTPKPASCQFAWGPSIQVTATGKGRFRCVSDTVAGSMRILHYGASLTIGRFRCTSRTTGMTCVDTNDGHGFRISRTSYSLF
jgi:hypothetical protein